MSRTLQLVALCFSLFSISFATASAAPAQLVANPDEQCLIKVPSPDAKWGQRFGKVVALSGDTMVVGTQSAGDDAIFVYVRSAEGWTLQQQMEMSSWPEAVAIHGDRLVVAVRASLQVWQRTDTQWVREATVALPRESYVARIAMDGDTIAAGVPFVDDDDDAVGAVYVCTRVNGTWGLRQKLTAGTSARVGFGWGLALDGSVLAVGAPGFDGAEKDVGAVYVFGRNGTTWSRTTRLTLPGAERELQLGHAVAVQGDRVVGGARGWGAWTGAVFTWTKSGSGWAYSHRVTAPDGSTGDGIDGIGDQFGLELVVAGDSLVVSSPGDDDAGPESGSLYVLRWSGGRWEQQRKIIPPHEDAGGGFGRQLATDAGRVAVGMSGDSSNEWNAGSVYAFDLGFVTPINTPLPIPASDILVNDSVPDRNAVQATAASFPKHGVLTVAASKGFTYTPPSGWAGADEFTYTCADGTAVSNAARIAVQTWSPTRAYLSVVHATPSYDGTATLKATIKTRKGAPVSGLGVILEIRGASGSWRRAATAVTASNGVATLRLPGNRTARTVRVRSVWSDTYGAASSASVRIKPHFHLSKPSAPASVTRQRSFTVSGSLKPRARAGSKPVQMRFYRRQSGKWVLKKSMWVKVANRATYSKYYGSVSLAAPGKWRVRAYRPATSTRAATWSRYTYIDVR